MRSVKTIVAARFKGVHIKAQVTVGTIERILNNIQRFELQVNKMPIDLLNRISAIDILQKGMLDNITIRFNMSTTFEDAINSGALKGAMNSQTKFLRSELQDIWDNNRSQIRNEVLNNWRKRKT